MALKVGDFLLVNYTLKVKESGETVDTTYDAVAKDAHIHREDSVYGPRFIILGEGELPKGLEEAIVGLDTGKQTTVELPPEKGFGARDPAKMRLVPMRRFREKNLDPIPGARIELDGRPATVRAVGAGRVQVDYNHPLSGRTLIYDVSVERVLEDDKEKILNIISRRIPEVEKNKFEIKTTNSELTIDIPEEAFYLSGLQVAKKSVTSDLQKYFPKLGTVSFREVFRRTEPKTEEAPPSPTITPAPSEPIQEESAKEAPEVTSPTKQRASAKKPATKSSRRRARMGSESQR